METPSTHLTRPRVARVRAARLRGIQQAVGAGRESGTDFARPSLPAPRTAAHCLMCEYDLSGQTIDRCPECGLRLASRYRDPTPWARAGSALRRWLATAVAVCCFDRRVRVRTSLVPITEASSAFSRGSIAAAAAIGGLVLGCSAALNATSAGLAAARFGAALALGGLTIATFLWLALRLLRGALHGRWRKLDFVPASVDYASGFWPLAALAALLLTPLYACGSRMHVTLLLAAATMAGAVLWGIWLWASAAESDRVRAAGLRVLSSVCLFIGGGACLPILVTWGVRSAIV